MSSSEKRPVTVMERLSTLIALGEGILPRIYYMKNKISKKRDIYLGGDRLLKVRKVLAIKFPKIPNDEKMAAIPNSDAFFSDIAGICRRLKGFSELTYTIMEFAASSSNLLLSIPKISMVTFSYEQHTEIVSAYLKLLKLYVRIFIFFSSIKEVKTVYAMYHAAVLFLNKQGKNKLQSHEVDQKYLSKLYTCCSPSHLICCNSPFSPPPPSSLFPSRLCLISRSSDPWPIITIKVYSIHCLNRSNVSASRSREGHARHANMTFSR